MNPLTHTLRRVPAGLAAVAGSLLLAAAPASARGMHFLAGAGQADTTPPAAGTVAGDAVNAQFAKLFASCSTAFGSPGRFALQEPFQDMNGTGAWDPGFNLSGGPDGKTPDPFCDANANGNWDGINADNGWGPATGVHDPVDVRAVAVSDGHHRPVVYASVKAIGLFDAYTEDARQILSRRYGVDADLVVSANHNESSPDTIGLYGALGTPLGVGARSGIDGYYMKFLDDRIAQAAALAVANLRPASLYANQVQTTLPDGASGNSYPLLTGLSQRLSAQFPTTVGLPGDDRIAAVDPKLGVLQARGGDGRPIFTVISLAAHNQEMGNAGAALSGDWPAAMERSFDAANPGMAMFLVGENGSVEDPQTTPTVVPNGSENHKNPATQWLQAQATGARFAAIAADAADHAVPLAPGTVRLHRRAICVPLENNGFIALAAAGDFGRRKAWVCDAGGHPLHAIPNGTVRATAGAEFRTFVAYADLGPDLQLIDNPGESFPALMLGSPFGSEEASCPRPNPAVPTWHAHALFRFQVGLADDLIGYLIPAWGFASGTPGLFNNDTCYADQSGHRHKLESESVGPTGGNDVANTLASMLDSEPDPSAHVVTGRYVRADGTTSRWPTGADGVLLSGDGTTLDAAHGKLIGNASTAAFGGRPVDETGAFMDYDGQPQARPDVTTRGIMVFGSDGCVAARYYLNVFPPLSAGGTLGSAQGGAVHAPQPRACPALMRGGIPELQPGAARAAGLRAG